MTINKKLLALVSTVVLTISITACSSQNNSANKHIEDKKLLSQGSTENNKTVDENEQNSSTDKKDDIDKQQNTDNANIGQDSKNDKENATEKYVYINASSLRVRQEPTLNSGIITSLNRGNKVKIIDEETSNNENWFNIELSGSVTTQSGWIHSDYAVDNLSDLNYGEFSNLDFSAQNKILEYEDNPRVEVKGIYVTEYSTSTCIDDLIAIANRTGVNAFVIDVKDDSGNMLFYTKAADKYNPRANKRVQINDINAFMKKLKDNNIYSIARIVSFKDPSYTKTHPDRAIAYKDSGKPFSNADGLIWATGYDRQLWEYNVAVAKEAAQAGFNEIQFDYVRFPASNNGKLDKKLNYRNTNNESKAKAIQEYLQYAYKELSQEHVYLAADVYGAVGSTNDDMGIGQYWEGISNVVDYICPMMYPSHYGKGVYGLNVPDANPYKTIFKSVEDSIDRNALIPTPAGIRPWIQDFTAGWVKGHINYGEKEVRAQIKALEDNGVNEFLLWNAGNKYTEAAIDK